MEAFKCHVGVCTKTGGALLNGAMKGKMLVGVKRIVMNEYANRPLIWQDSVRPGYGCVNGIFINRVGIMHRALVSAPNSCAYKINAH